MRDLGFLEKTHFCSFLPLLGSLTLNRASYSETIPREEGCDPATRPGSDHFYLSQVYERKRFVVMGKLLATAGASKLDAF